MPEWTQRATSDSDRRRGTRRRLLDRYAGNSAALGIYLSTQLTAAVPDLRHLPPEELYERFLGWLRLA